MLRNVIDSFSKAPQGYPPVEGDQGGGLATGVVIFFNHPVFPTIRLANAVSSPFRCVDTRTCAGEIVENFVKRMARNELFLKAEMIPFIDLN